MKKKNKVRAFVQDQFPNSLYVPPIEKFGGIPDLDRYRLLELSKPSEAAAG